MRVPVGASEYMSNRARTGTEEKLCAMAQGTIARPPDKSETT